MFWRHMTGLFEECVKCIEDTHHVVCFEGNRCVLVTIDPKTKVEVCQDENDTVTVKCGTRLKRFKKLLDFRKYFNQIIGSKCSCAIM